MAPASSPIPHDLAAAWAREVGQARHGLPTWTVASRGRFSRAVGPNEAVLAAELARPFGSPGLLMRDGAVRFDFVKGGRRARIFFDPRTGLFEGREVEGQHGLLNLASFIWSLDGAAVGPLEAANRLTSLLGLAMLQTGGGAR